MLTVYIVMERQDPPEHSTLIDQQGNLEREYSEAIKPIGAYSTLPKAWNAIGTTWDQRYERIDITERSVTIRDREHPHVLSFITIVEMPLNEEHM